jgi:hypothetical protein
MDREGYAQALVPWATRLVGAVRDEGPAAVRAVFDAVYRVSAPSDVAPAEVLAVLLAAMVDDSRPAVELLAWYFGPPGGMEVLRRAHAERERLRYHGRPVPDELRALDSRYHQQRRVAGAGGAVSA